MQKLQYDYDILEEQEFSNYSDTPLTTSNTTLTSVKNLQSDLNIIVTDSARDRALSKAMISIDSIRRTAVCNQNGQVCISSIPFGSYHLDIISVGYIAQRIVINIQSLEVQEVHVQMISNS